MDLIQLIGYSFRILFALVAGAFLVRAWIRLLKRTASAEGHIERISPGVTRRSRVGGGPAVWRTSTPTAEVRFDVLERSYRFDHDYYPGFDNLKVGDTIPVLYDPNDPMNAKVDGGKRFRYNELTILSLILLAFVWFVIIT